jgi:hypothetical protein
MSHPHNCNIKILAEIINNPQEEEIYIKNDCLLLELFHDSNNLNKHITLKRVSVLNSMYSALSKVNQIRIVEIAELFDKISNEFYNKTFSNVENNHEKIFECIKKLHKEKSSKINNFLSFATKYLFWSKYANSSIQEDYSEFYIYDSCVRAIINYYHKYKELPDINNKLTKVTSTKKIDEYKIYCQKYSEYKNTESQNDQYLIDKKLWILGKNLLKLN